MATQKKRPKPAHKNTARKRAPTKTSWKKGQSGSPETQIKPGQDLNQNRSKYDPAFAEQARKLCVLGATNAVLADFFGVNLSTIRNWSATHEAFNEALKEGREAFDDEVERALAQRAIGYEIEIEKVFNWQGQIVTHKTTEHVPADVGAAKCWLGTRRRETWGSPDRLELTGKDGGPIETESRSDVEVARRIAFALAKAQRLKREQEQTIEHDAKSA